MKTVSDFKRQLAPGVKLHTIFHQKTAGRDSAGNLILTDEDKGIREVSIVQTNSFALKTPKTDGTVVDSWCSYPKATTVKIIDENTIQILEPDFRINRSQNPPLIPCLTYKFILS